MTHFASLIRQFSWNLDSLRDFIRVIDPFLEERGREVVRSRPQDMIPILAALQEVCPEVLPKKVSIRKLERAFGGRIHLKPSSQGKGTRVTVSTRKRDAFSSAMEEFGKAAKRKEMRRRIIVVRMIS